jgi:heterodisulfide reductase subunit C
MEVIRIKYDKDEVVKTVHTSEICYKCSACSKYCPITMYVEKYNLENSFIVHLFAGMGPEEWKQCAKDVWMCSACEKCVSICPQDGDPTHVFNNLKQKSYRDGLAPDSIYGLVNSLLDTSWAYLINPALNRNRAKLGLKDLAPNKNVAGELQTLAKEAGLKRKGE